jgi:hypothetical protein
MSEDIHGNPTCPKCNQPVAMEGPFSMSLLGMCYGCLRDYGSRIRDKQQAALNEEVEKILVR